MSIQAFEADLDSKPIRVYSYVRITMAPVTAGLYI